MTDEQGKDKGTAGQSVVTAVTETTGSAVGTVVAAAANLVSTPAPETKESETKVPAREAKAAPVKEARRPPAPRKKLSPQAERLAQIKRDKRKKHHRLMYKQTRG